MNVLPIAFAEIPGCAIIGIIPCLKNADISAVVINVRKVFIPSTKISFAFAPHNLLDKMFLINAVP